MTVRLLIVDDSRMSRLLLQNLVEHHHPDWSIRQATSGDEALLIAREAPLDLVSMDYNMRGMNGLDAALALRALQPQARVVLLSANVQTALQQRALDAGIPFLPKPITAATVAAMAQAVGG